MRTSNSRRNHSEARQRASLQSRADQLFEQAISDPNGSVLHRLARMAALSQSQAEPFDAIGVDANVDDADVFDGGFDDAVEDVEELEAAGVVGNKRAGDATCDAEDTGKEKDNDVDADDDPEYVPDCKDLDNNVLSTVKSMPRVAELLRALHLAKKNYSEFSILQLVAEMITTETATALPHDADQQLYPGAPHSKIEFAEHLRAWSQRYSISRAAEEELLTTLLPRHFPIPGLNLPVMQNIQENMKSDVSQYVPEEERDLWFDICTRSCCVYVGQYSYHVRCPECKSPRFSHCHEKECRLKDYDACGCNLQKRTPLKRMHYRPIIPLFMELVQNASFRDAVDYTYIRPRKNRIYDVMQGSEPRRQMRAMRAKYDKDYPGGRCPETGHPVSFMGLCISQFYDGAKVFSKKTVVFWPLFIGILNLPPTYRMRPGVGMFLAAVFTAELGSAAENFMFLECLLPELKKLNKGLIVPLENGERLCLMVRLVQHLCDGRAQEKIFKVRLWGFSLRFSSFLIDAFRRSKVPETPSAASCATASLEQCAKTKWIASRTSATGFFCRSVISLGLLDKQWRAVREGAMTGLGACWM